VPCRVCGHVSGVLAWGLRWLCGAAASCTSRELRSGLQAQGIGASVWTASHGWWQVGKSAHCVRRVSITGMGLRHTICVSGCEVCVIELVSCGCGCGCGCVRACCLVSGCGNWWRCVVSRDCVRELTAQTDRMCLHGGPRLAACGIRPGIDNIQNLVSLCTHATGPAQ
jgi:hypothetical protein